MVVEDKQIKEELAPVAWRAQNSFKCASHFVILLARKKMISNAALLGIDSCPVEGFDKKNS